MQKGREKGIPGDGEPESPIDDDGNIVLLPDYEKIRIAIARLKYKNSGGGDG